MNPHYKVIELICTELNISVDVLLSDRRFAEIVKCRGLIVLILREIYNLNFRQISAMLNRNTSTIIRMYHKLDIELTNNNELYREYYILYNLLKKKGMIA